LGLDIKKPVLLMMGGGDAVGPFVDVLKSLAKVKTDFQILVIAGRNKEMRKYLIQKFKVLGLQGEVLGFVENIEDYMRSADLLISKAGGLTTTESLTLGLPMLVVRPTPGQEDGNTEYLVKNKAGIYVKDIKKIGGVVEKLLKNPKKIEEMSENAKKLSKPKAAEMILREMEKFL